MIGGSGSGSGSAPGSARRGGHLAGDDVTLRLTVVDPSRAGAAADVEVTAPRGTPLGAVRGHLLAAVGHPPGRAAVPPGLFVDGTRVDDTPLGLPPVLHGTVVTVGRAGGGPGRGAGTCGGLAEIHVVAGPDAGVRHPLSPGPTPLGRCAGVALRIADPDVSRVHAEVVTAGTAVRVRDVGSLNGTVLGASAVDHTAVAWVPGEFLQVGGSVLALRTADGDPAGGGGPASAHPDGAGRLLVNPAPRLPPPPFAGRVTFPEPPPEGTRPRLPWVAVVLPLALSVPLAWLMHQVVLLAFALLSPVMLLAQYLLDRRERHGEGARLARRYGEESAEAQAALDRLLAAERARLLLDHPDPAAVGAIAAGPLQRLWERRAGDGDELVLRLGLGDRDSAVEVDGAPPPGSPWPGGAPPRLAGVPVTLDLAGPGTGGVTGIAGPRREALALARSLVGQAAVTNSPHQLRIAVLTDRGDGPGDGRVDGRVDGRGDARDGAWDWVAWLPHATGTLPPPPGGGDPFPEAGAARAGPRFLLVLDGAERLRRDPRVARLLAAAGDRVVALCLDGDEAKLPAECGATVRVAPPGSTPGAVLALRGSPPRELRPDLVSPGWSERLGRDLARLADATPASTANPLPARVRLLDLILAGPSGPTGPTAPTGPTGPATTAPTPTTSPTATGADRLDAGAVAAGWAARRAARASATTAVIGVTGDGPWRLDLARQGPHVLVAGTTGAGKSELLTTVVTALALAHPPDRLHLLLVDYKGGTAFGPLGGLPHAAGVLTDLDEHLARRALSSLRAELRRREALLRGAGATDLDAYERRRPAGGDALPRLVIVVDEFRVLSEELPDLLAGLVRVAVVGRSLGVHLVLATQRPAGVVTAEMRANVNLRIALRVRDRMDSEDVVEAPDAASLPADRPGRGVYRTGSGPLVEFQAALAGGRPVAVDPAPGVRTLRRDGRLVTAWHHDRPSGPAPGAAAGPATPDELTLIVQACRAAVDRDGSPPARPPWLPPLPEVIRPRDLPALLPTPVTGAPAGSGSGGARAPVRLDLGVTDLPSEQARGPLRWDLHEEGHLAVVGAPGTGRTGVLRAIAGAAGRLPGSLAGRLPGSPPGTVHVHVVDGGGRLGDLAGLAHVGTVVPAPDTERAARLLARLGELARRDPCGTGGDGEPAAVVLLVDGWEQVLDAWLPVEHGRLVDELVRLARDGAGSGIRLAVTGGRGLLSGPVSGVLTERLLLRAADPTDLVLAGVPVADVPGRMPPGRAVRVLPGGRAVEAQVLLDDLAAAPGGTGGAPRTTGVPAPAPFRLAPLPGRVSVGELLDAARPRARQPPGHRRPPSGSPLAGGVVPLGLGGDDASPLGPPARGEGWLVAGQPGSGRSTALATAVEVLHAAGRPVVVVAGPGSPPAGVADRIASGTAGPGSRGGAAVVTVSPWAARDAAARLLAVLDRHPHATLVVDDAALLADTPAEDDLLARLDSRAVHGPGQDAGPAARWPAGPGPHVLAGCTPGQAALAFRGLAARLRTTACGLLLAPVAPTDGEAFGVRVPAIGGAPPGRGLVVTPGLVQAVQVAGPGPS